MNFKRLICLPILSVLLLISSCSSVGGLTGSAGSLLALAQGNPKLSKFMTLAQAAGISGLLSGADPLTILAPSNNAFAALGNTKFQELLDPDNKEMLTDILKNHVLSGSVDAKDMAKAGSVTNLLGNTLDVSGSGNNITVGGANILEKDMKADNGIIQMVDQLILP
ncbi:fasciclin domain-containing protein [Persicobacter diffluens]|uniref:FAS1 domain-containing protein n=1 Tax=Persicobacter diffluens TaxID=981 RepID=A0AAN4W0T8_9BACT|nr:hypothetical protein PEDI_27890 [Persicobacter diffluens]